MMEGLEAMGGAPRPSKRDAIFSVTKYELVAAEGIIGGLCFG